MHNLKPFVADLGGTVVEVGSRDGHDARKIAEIFGAKRVITIEANIDCYHDIEKKYPYFENYNLVIGDKTGASDFYKVDHKHGEVLLGQSSVLYKPSYDTIATRVSVPALTMDDFVDFYGINDIEVMKIDVEGFTYQVLQGFTKIRMTRLLHVESEQKEFWDDQKLYSDTARHLVDAGYEQVYFSQVWTDQSDSIWLRKD